MTLENYNRFIDDHFAAERRLDQARYEADKNLHPKLCEEIRALDNAGLVAFAMTYINDHDSRVLALKQARREVAREELLRRLNAASPVTE